ncbi:hypothetical protein QBE53_04435 [Vallitaleaceae bacterium 9-2]
MYRDRIEKVDCKVIIKGEELYSYKGRLRNHEDIKNEVLANFAREFMAEVEKLIEEKGKDYVMGLCTRE